MLAELWRAVLSETRAGRGRAAAEAYLDAFLPTVPDWREMQDDPRISPAMLADVREQLVAGLVDVAERAVARGVD